MGLGYVEGVTHDLIRHGNTTLFAALDVNTCEVITQCNPRYRHQEFLGFLRQIEKLVPGDLGIRLIVVNYFTHNHAKVRAWLAKRPRFHVHYTPTYACSRIQVERWYGIISQQAIRRGSFSSLKQLIARIEPLVAAYNKTNTPFNWTASADSILETLQGLCAQISRTAHTMRDGISPPRGTTAQAVQKQTRPAAGHGHPINGPGGHGHQGLSTRHQ